MSKYIDYEAAVTAIAEYDKWDASLDFPLASDDIEDYKNHVRSLLEDIPTIEINDPVIIHDAMFEGFSRIEKVMRMESAKMAEIIREAMVNKNSK